MTASTRTVSAYAFIDAAQLRSQLDPARQCGSSFAEWAYIDMARVAHRAVAEVAIRSPRTGELVLERILVYDVPPREALDPRLGDGDDPASAGPPVCMSRVDARLTNDALSLAAKAEFDLALLVTSGSGLRPLVQDLHRFDRTVGVVSFRSGLADEPAVGADLVGYLPDVSDSAWAYELSSSDGDF
jgi:hypothetical protein